MPDAFEHTVAAKPSLGSLEVHVGVQSLHAPGGVRGPNVVLAKARNDGDEALVRIENVQKQKSGH